MKTLQITESNARKLYNDATPEFKTTLEDTFGKEFFSQKITDRVKTYRDACHETGETPIIEENMRVAGFTEDEINYRKLKTITKALNEGWVPDWTDDDESKWIPWFGWSSSGFAFCDTDCSYSHTDAGNGSRLCFKSDELATYAGKQFADIYKGFMF